MPDNITSSPNGANEQWLSSRAVSFRNKGVVLAGTLVVPATPGPHPAVAMVHGSGPGDRDYFGYFTPIREHFVRHGIAVLCWDKPGVGESTGDWRQQSFRDRADEALAAAGFLHSHDDIKQHQVGLWGISQGGWIVPYAASLSSDIAFIIPVSAPGITPAEQDVYAVEHTMRADGCPEEQIEQAVAYVRSLLDAACVDDGFARFSRIIRAAQDERWQKYYAVGEDLWPFFHVNRQQPYDPIPVLEQVICPVLAIFGERDLLLPVEASVAAVERALAKAGNHDVTIRVFPHADHLICTTQPNGYASGYLDAMTSWILQRREPPH